jgi:hypothetical protein
MLVVDDFDIHFSRVPIRFSCEQHGPMAEL